MRLLSEIDEFNKFIFCFLKFSKKEYLEPLRKGNLYMNNLQYFVDLEKKNGIKGMGDSYEGGHVMNDIKLQFRDPETDEVIFEGEAKRSIMRPNSLLELPVFCLTAVDSSMLEIIEEDETQYLTRLIFNPQQKLDITTEFGDHALVISRDEFLEQVVASFNEHGYQYRASSVKYTDYNINQEERMKSFQDEDPSFFFWKSDLLSYQKEYRIVIFNKPSKDAININIGDMSNFSLILPVTQLLDKQNGLNIVIKKPKGNFVTD